MPHHVVTDNAGGHLMQRGLVDLVITGTDRTTAAGDVCNKIGTYLKALAAADNGVPFYVALPSPTIDFRLESGADIPIEERSADEVAWVHGRDPEGRLTRVRVTARGLARGQPRLRRDPRPPRHRPHHREGRRRRRPRRHRRAFPRAGGSVTATPAERRAIVATCLGTPAIDVTPARLVTGPEKGIVAADRAALVPERAAA